MNQNQNVPGEGVTEIMDRARAERLGLPVPPRIEPMYEEAQREVEGGSFSFGESQSGAARMGWDLK